MNTFFRAIAIAFLLATMGYLSSACSTYNDIDIPGHTAAQFGEPCGFHDGVDRGVCDNGLECFGTCTFVCGMMYNDVGDYGLNQQSLDRCTTIGGSCDEYKTVGINVCQMAQPLPNGCSVQSENVRTQLCPNQPVAVVCTDVNQTVPRSGCAGPDWTEGRQVTGNAWCCQ